MYNCIQSTGEEEYIHNRDDSDIEMDEEIATEVSMFQEQELFYYKVFNTQGASIK